jgi:tetratricopeptide (TPR) repeat protein
MTHPRLVAKRLSPLVAASGAAALLIVLSHCASAQAHQPQFPRAVPPGTAGDLLFAHGEYLEAIDAYSHAPADAATLNKIGVAWHHLSAVDQARTSYEKALALQPNFPDALNNLGATWFAEKKYSRAIRLYRRALQLSPNSAVTAANLGTAYFAQGKPGPGIEAYRAAFSLDSTVFDLDSPSIVNGPITDQERALQDYCIAELFAERHNQSRALEYLRKAFGAGFKDSKRVWQDRAFAELRLSADFADLMAEVGPK